MSTKKITTKENNKYVEYLKTCEEGKLTPRTKEDWVEHYRKQQRLLAAQDGN